jgi:predicted transposase YdaD
MANHDQLFKTLLRTFFCDFLGLVAPQIREKVSPTDIQIMEQEHFADWPNGRKLQVDLLARVLTRHGFDVASFLVHVEVEARFRRTAPRRLRAYFHVLKARYDEPVLPILVSLRGGPAGLSLQVLEEQLPGHCQQFAYIAFGLKGCRSGDYLEMLEPVAWALAALMRHPKARRAEIKLACLGKINHAALSDLETLVLVNCVETYLELTPEETATFEHLRSLEADREVEAVQETWADRMRAEGIQIGLEKGREQGLEKGLEKGLEQGLTKGRQEGARQLLLKLLVQRFGELPAACRRRIAAIRSLDRLAGLAERVFTARSLDELGLA